MHAPLWLIRCISAALSVLAYGAVVAQQERPLCATANLDTILRNSGASKAAQERLRSEFNPQFAAIEPLTSERNRTERQWLDAKQGGRPDDEVNALKTQYDKAAAAEREAARPLQQLLDRRKKEELGALVRDINEIYKRIGAEQGFKLLLQEGEQEPAFVLDRSTKRSGCKDAVDLTSQTTHALDQGETAGR
jgi:Skp family chaperone for outer membrane proteins